MAMRKIPLFLKDLKEEGRKERSERVYAQTERRRG